MERGNTNFRGIMLKLQNESWQEGDLQGTLMRRLRIWARYVQVVAKVESEKRQILAFLPHWMQYTLQMHSAGKQREKERAEFLTEELLEEFKGNVRAISITDWTDVKAGRSLWALLPEYPLLLLNQILWSPMTSLGTQGEGHFAFFCLFLLLAHRISLVSVKSDNLY